jgi:transcriptional regulator with XRE-family HTH domain
MLRPVSEAHPTEPLSDDAAFSARLKAAREERAFTQGAVANRTKMIDAEGRGVSRTAIIGYEQGTTKPGIRELRLLCEVLHVTPNWLIYGGDSAAKAAVPSIEFLSKSSRQMRDVVTLALALLAIKGHERDSLLAIALSLAGRQLGDVRLSALMAWGGMLEGAFEKVLKEEFPDQASTLGFEDFTAWLASEGWATNQGNRFRLGEEGEVLNPDAALYPGPHPWKSRES